MINLKVKQVKTKNNNDEDTVFFETDYKNKHTNTLEHIVGIERLICEILNYDENDLELEEILNLVKENIERRQKNL